MLYFYKGLEPTALLYSVYALVAILGYKKWNKLLQKQYAYLQTLLNMVCRFNFLAFLLQAP